jgi:O-antigen/teichoic acid export membrane protein
MAFYKSLKNQYNYSSLKTMGIYTITNFFGKGLSFLLLPLFTNPKYLTPADNGLLSLFSQAIIFLTPFISLGILQSTSVDYFKLDKKSFKDFCTTGIFMAVSMSLISFLLFYLLRGFLFQRFSFPVTFIWAIPLLTLMFFFYEFTMLIIRNRNNTVTYANVNVTKISVELGSAVILIVLLAWGWKGRVAGIMLATCLVAIYGIYFLLKNDYLFGSIKRKIIYTELQYSIPIATMQLSMFCLFSSDSFLLAGITKNNSQVGIYGMACVFGSIIITLCSAIIQYMVPKINKALSCAEIDYADLRNQFLIYISIMVFAFVTLLFLVPVAYHLFINENYWPGIQYYYFISSGYFFWTISFFLYTFLFYHKQKKKLFALAIISIIISICSNYYFIKNFSSLGAAVSVCCIYFIVMLLAIIATRKYWKPIFHSRNA